MRTLVLGLLALQAAPAPTGPAGQAGPTGPSEEPQSEAPLQADVEPWEGTLAAGIQAIRSEAESGELEAALALSERVLAPTEFARLRRDWAERSDGWSEWIFGPAEPLFDGLGLGGWPDPELGEVHYARGLVRGLEMNAEEAIAEFERAAALAEDGSLRLDALYDAGATMLAVAEAAFAQVPEISGAPQGAPGMPGAPGAGADSEAPDPLDLAEAAFQLAKEKLIVRLRADWKDEDTRANLEWIQRRLAEIEELRQQREEQQQEQQSDENQDGEPNEDSEEQDQEQQDQEQQDEQDQEQQDQEQQDQQDEEQEDQEQQDGESEESEDEEPTEAEAPQPEPGEEGEEQPAAPEEGEELAERVLTREEVMRLLDLLQEIEEEGERVRARARAQGRQKVEKDW